MPSLLPQLMVFAGSILMVYNIMRYLRYARRFLDREGWERERRVLLLPIVLLIGFLAGYVVVGLLGSPDFVVAGILLGGSVFVLCMIAFLEHVTGRIQESEHLSAQLQIAQESSRAKSGFLSIMSHEIRTPLNAIIGLNALMLSDESLTPSQHDRSLKIDASARHLLLLVNDVLDMSRIESGKMTLAHESFSLEELLSHVDGIIDSQCTVKGLTYHCEVIGAVDAGFVGDETKLSQALINVLGNAVKFTDAPGAVSLAVEQIDATDDRRTLRFTLSDTGVGIDEEYLPKLFDAFTQEDASTTTRYGGSGLGMAITRTFVDMMDGSIKVQSAKGAGTTITITVTLDACPCCAAEAMGLPHDQRPEGCPPDTTNVSLEGMHVLAAEDMPINAEILLAILQSADIVCELVSDGREAVERFAASEEGFFDAVLMDVRMPVMDGLTATREIRALDRADSSTVPIIALTANAFDEDMRQSLEAGMNAHLSKPLEPERLFATLRELYAISAVKK